MTPASSDPSKPGTSTGFRRVLQEIVLLTALAFVPFAGTPAIVQAQEVGLNPFPIADGLTVSRGRIDPSDPATTTALSHEEACMLATEGWGWADCATVEAMLLDTTPETDIMIIHKPDSSGYVSFDDWTEAGVTELVRVIEADLRAGAADQSARTGQTITFAGWRVPPTLDRERNIMYYATDWSFDGDPTINVFATLFDRRGYVDFALTPFAADLGTPQVETLIRDNLALYSPAQSESYAAFVSGDKVAAVGALGLLGTFFGVKYGKAAGGFLATALLFFKKFGVVAVMGVLALGGVLMRGLRSLFAGRSNENV